MREIKFRIRYLGNEEAGTPASWVYFTFPEDLKDETYCASDSYDWNTFSEWIGRQDKNGKEIFEGDIVSYINRTGGDFWNNPNTVKCFDQVIYKESFNYVGDIVMGFIFERIKSEYLGNWELYEQLGLEDKSFNEKVEVVGNIYQNPELLKS